MDDSFAQLADAFAKLAGAYTALAAQQPTPLEPIEFAPAQPWVGAAGGVSIPYNQTINPYPTYETATVTTASRPIPIVVPNAYGCDCSPSATRCPH